MSTSINYEPTALDSVREVIMLPCSRCEGAGIMKQYMHVNNGECFKCGGSGRSQKRKFPMKPDEQFHMMRLDGHSYATFNIWNNGSGSVSICDYVECSGGYKPVFSSDSGDVTYLRIKYKGLQFMGYYRATQEQIADIIRMH